MEKQEMEMETEMEMENWNGNSCKVVSNHWTGLTQFADSLFWCRTEAKCAYSAYYLLLSLHGQASCLESIEVKGHVHIQ